jgi:hypothetical protein
MIRNGFFFLLAFSLILLLVGCENETTANKQKKTETSQEQQTSNPPQQQNKTKQQIAGLPLIKAAEAKLKQSKGATLSVMGTQTLSLKDESNPGVNQLSLEGKETRSPYVLYLKGTLNQQVPTELYLDDQMIYEKINNWKKRSHTSYRRNPADSILMMNKLMSTLSQFNKETGLHAEKIGKVVEIGIDKAAFQGTPIEEELKTYQQKAIEREVNSQTPDQKVEAVNIDDLGLQITISDQTKEYTKITTTIKTSYKVGNKIHVVEEELTKSWTGPNNAAIEIPADARNAPSN